MKRKRGKCEKCGKRRLLPEAALRWCWDCLMELPVRVKRGVPYEK
jgi:hypothetical protein